MEKTFCWNYGESETIAGSPCVEENSKEVEAFAKNGKDGKEETTGAKKSRTDTPVFEIRKGSEPSGRRAPSRGPAARSARRRGGRAEAAPTTIFLQNFAEFH